MNELNELYTALSHAEGIFLYVSFAIRFLLPALAILVLIRCLHSLLDEKQEEEVWGYLSHNGKKIPLCHFENTLGSGVKAEVQIDAPNIQAAHAALIRDGHGQWRVYPMTRHSEIYINGDRVRSSAPIEEGDELLLGDTILTFSPASQREEQLQAVRRRKPGKRLNPGVTLFILTEFQLLLCAAHWIAEGKEVNLEIPISFGVMIGLCWCYYFFMRALRRTGLEVEILAFFLCTIGLSICASSTPSALYKQLAFFVVGLVLYLLLGWFLRDLNRIKALRYPMAIGGILLLAVNLVLGGKVFGARNWLSVGGFTFQPSEFVKVCFVFAGAATLDRLFDKRNLFWFVAFSGVCVVALVLMSDFGTASVFFVAYLVIAFLRSGNIATMVLSVSGAGLAGVLAMTVKPYIVGRFSTWLHAWEFANEGGYQQTRTMIAAANGALFGVGAGSGALHKVFAADTDMVFGMVCEELGLLIGLMAMGCFAIWTIFIVRSAQTARSSFYVIGACGALACMLIQIILNVLGAFDILPFTGVTFPFLSKGGSSLISCWCLLAFIKAADTRQNASFAVRLPKAYRKVARETVSEEDEEEDE